MRRATAWGPVALVFSALLPLMANAAAADAQDRAAPPDPGGQEPPPLDQAGAGDTVVQPLPESGTTVTITKKVDASGTVTQEVRDHRGRGVDLAQVLAAEGAARQRRHGRVDRELGSMLAAAGGARQRTPVAIWVNSPAVAVNRGAPLDEQLSQLDLAVDPTRRAVLDAIRRFPNQRGARPARFGPVVFADLTPGQIRAVAARDDVSMVYGQTEYSLTNDDATTSEGAARVWQQGNVGTGSRPVVLEPDGVSDTHPDLNNGTHPVVFWCASVSTACPQGKQINNAPFGTHASQVAGVISSTNAQYRGTAPNAQLILSANSQDFSDANLVAAFEWARRERWQPDQHELGVGLPRRRSELHESIRRLGGEEPLRHGHDQRRQRKQFRGQRPSGVSSRKRVERDHRRRVRRWPQRILERRQDGRLLASPEPDLPARDGEARSRRRRRGPCHHHRLRVQRRLERHELRRSRGGGPGRATAVSTARPGVLAGDEQGGSAGLGIPRHRGRPRQPFARRRRRHRHEQQRRHVSARSVLQ